MLLCNPGLRQGKRDHRGPRPVSIANWWALSSVSDCLKMHSRQQWVKSPTSASYHTHLFKATQLVWKKLKISTVFYKLDAPPPDTFYGFTLEMVLAIFSFTEINQRHKSSSWPCVLQWYKKLFILHLAVALFPPHSLLFSSDPTTSISRQFIVNVGIEGICYHIWQIMLNLPINSVIKFKYRNVNSQVFCIVLQVPMWTTAVYLAFETGFLNGPEPTK